MNSKKYILITETWFVNKEASAFNGFRVSQVSNKIIVRGEENEH